MRLARSGPPSGEIPVVAGQHGRWHDLRPVTADVVELEIDDLGQQRQTMRDA
jgi:hypothetical protein